MSENCNCGDGCGCGQEHENSSACGCGNDEVMETIKITLEDNTELECHVLGTFEIVEVEYVALLPIGSEEVLVYRYELDGEDVNLSLIESDEEFELVSQAFDEIFGEGNIEEE